MAIRPGAVVPEDIDYPTSDGRPMAETDVHRDDMLDLIATLKARYADDPQVYVSGNLLLYYVRGDQRRHVSPDVFVVRGVPKHRRDYFLLWQEAKGPDIVIELTSQSTRQEDLDDKFQLYRDTLRVPEYFLFDPHTEYLDPPLQGYRLEEGQYVLIEAVDGRLPSEVLGLHLERHGWELRLYDPATSRWLPTPQEEVAQTQATLRQVQAMVHQTQEAQQQILAKQREMAAALQESEAGRRRAEAALQESEAGRQRAEAAWQRAEAAWQRTEAALRESEAGRRRAEAEIERLGRELDDLRRRLPEEES